MLTNDELLLTFLVNAAWQIPAIAGLAAITTRLLRKGPASYRHVVWVIALIAAVIVPVRSATTHRVTASLALDVPAATELTTDPAATRALPRNTSSVSRPSPRSVNLSSTSATIAIAAYFALVLFALIRLTIATARTLLMLRKAERETPLPALATTWAHCTEAFGVTDATLFRSAHIQGPVALGVFKPAVII